MMPEWGRWAIGVSAAVVAFVLLAWWVGWIPDGIVGWPLLVALLGVSGAAGVAYAARSSGVARRIIGVACVLGAMGIAVWLPLSDLSGSNVIASRELTRSGDTVALPAVSEEHERVELVAHARVLPNSGDVPYRLTLTTPEGERLEHADHFMDRVLGGGRRSSHRTRHDTVWGLPSKLSSGGVVSVQVPGADTLEWPVVLEIRDPGLRPVHWLLLASPLLCAAILLDAQDKRAPAVALSGLVAAAVTFAIAFDGAWVPGHLTRAVLAGAILAALASLPAHIGVRLARGLGLKPPSAGLA